VQWYNIITII